MIALTYALSGVLLAITGYLFGRGTLSATGQTVAWSVIFFFASAAASSAYLTVSETFLWKFGRWPSPSSMPWAQALKASLHRLSSGC